MTLTLEISKFSEFASSSISDLPLRAARLNQEQMEKTFGGGCRGEGRKCITGWQCCYPLACDGWIGATRRCRRRRR